MYGNSIMQRIYFILMVFISGCNTISASDGVVSLNRHEISQAETIELLKLAQNSNIGDISRWHNLGVTLYFTGKLNKGDCELFVKNADITTKNLHVNSAGGDAFVGLCIANEMQKRKFKQTIVEGICVSSCANYLFLGSTTRFIKRGIVGFHGNITALMLKDPNNVALRQQLIEAKIAPAEINRVISEFSKQQIENSVLEQKFLFNCGVSQILFDRTQLSDKGTGDGANYTFLLPLPETFLKYGILNVEGKQEFSIGRSMGMNNLLQ
jgi:hypothetical protein